MATILLIEDSRLLRLAGERTLVKAGHKVITQIDGDAGLRAARTAKPDLILLDMMLPKLSGLDLLRMLKEDATTSHIPVIILSGLAQSNQAKLIKDGAAAFLVKSEEMMKDGPTGLAAVVADVLSKAKA